MTTYEHGSSDCSNAEYCDKTGTILSWPARRTYGFIQQDDGGKKVFVHLTEVISNERLKPGVRVKYNVRFESEKGKFRAINVCEVPGEVKKKKKETEKETKADHTCQEPVLRSAAAAGGAAVSSVDDMMDYTPPDGIEVCVMPVKQHDGLVLQGPETADGKRSLGIFSR